MTVLVRTRTSRYLSSVIVPGEELLVSDLILAQQDLLWVPFLWGLRLISRCSSCLIVFVWVGKLPLVKKVLYLHTNLGDFHPVFLLLSRFELACARWWIINPFLLYIGEFDPDPDLRNKLICWFHSTSTRSFFCWVGWSALIKPSRSCWDLHHEWSSGRSISWHTIDQ